MNVRLLCNAGLEFENNGKILLVDLPNTEIMPFSRLPDDAWRRLCGSPHICGFCFTHSHPDHYDQERLRAHMVVSPKTPVFMPDDNTTRGVIRIGGYTIEYCNIEHAPLPLAPAHVVLIVSNGEKSVYISGDSITDVQQHRKFLNGRRVDAAIWTPMYLSRPSTRALMNEISDRNYIYHMPQKPFGMEYWKKCENNMTRYSHELISVKVLENYPAIIDL